MTREEATNHLKDILAEATETEHAVCYVTNEDAEALDMAIEALEEYESLAKSLNDAAELIHKLQRKNEWIPCSDRLPKNEVLCCDVHQNLMIGYAFVSESSNTGYSAESECEYMFDCIAWMPLPEPMRLENES